MSVQKQEERKVIMSACVRCAAKVQPGMTEQREREREREREQETQDKMEIKLQCSGYEGGPKLMFKPQA